MTRRELLVNVPLLAGAGASAFGGDKPSRQREKNQRMPYELLIQGGRVIDHSQSIDAVRDVAISNGQIALVAESIPASQARQVIDARNRIVSPGLIDIHTHVFPRVGPYGIEPDPYCVGRGVTTAVDAGTSGARTFPALRHDVLERSQTRVRALLHVVSIGMVAGSTPNMGELEDLRYCVPEMAVKTAEANQDYIVGFKIRFSKQYTGPNDLEGMKRARRAADDARLPLMIHIGGSFTPLPELLAYLKPGDVVTHSFNAHPHGLLDGEGKVIAAVAEARQRGVLFDVGHGAGSFSFDVMKRCMDQNFLPDTISSDLYSANVNGPVYDLLTTLSKFLLLGMSLPDVLRRCTLASAGVFKYGSELGTLKAGVEADVSVLSVQKGDFTFTDSEGQTRTGREKLVPVVTVRAGKTVYPAA